jgi:nitrate reductase NapA
MNMFSRLDEGKIKAIWINTTNPGQSLPNASRYRKAMKNAFTVVSDVYPTRTTELASVILPSAMWIEREGVMGQTDRRSQLTPKLVDPPEDARPDFWQIREIARKLARKLGKKTGYRVIDPETGAVRGVKEVFGLGFETEKAAWDEYRLCSKGQDVDLWGTTYEKLRAHAGGIQWPCTATDFNNRGTAKRYISKEYARKVFGKTKKSYKTGYVTLFDQHMEQRQLPGPINYYGHHPFHVGAKGKAIIRVLPAALDYEMPDKEYPYVLNTGRVIEHWHSGTITMRVRMLRELNPHAYVEVSPEDADNLGVKNGSPLKLVSRRGEIVLPVWVTKRARPGMVFVPWFDQGMLINLLTIDVPESWSGAGQPDYKVCAVKLAKV